MTQSPLFILLLFGGALYLAKIWYEDFRANAGAEPHPRALPGAFPAPRLALLIAAGGALFLVLVETGGEIALGVSAEQSDITVLFLLAMVGAGIIEEVLFRGYLVVEGKGRAWLIGSILLFSLLFSLAHYQYYVEVPEEGSWTEFTFKTDAKSAWSLLLLFLNSLWFYAVRFLPFNPRHSLLPCFVAHISSNLGVFIVKAAQGHVTSLF
ncbi:MAG: CPBP family intramembrane metalloprotease [Verrucomicrobia bacterium]|jgi:membrane protease YdiL (CAAX protease family)|nr:CPBP family intramembrane metalloprotease [Verrucomicrobiota bacterium]